jgi:peptidyl-prolyl cis-trans isomerase A (cyclophilin A)
MEMKAVLFGCVLTIAILFSGCGTSDPMWKPSFATLAMHAPDSFDVAMETSSGTIDFRFVRQWSPLGVDRAFYLFKYNFFQGTRFYRVIDDFVAQFGGSGDAKLDSLWRSISIKDEPVLAQNRKGTISFARSGARTRSMTMYINLKDNLRLDSLDSGQVVGYPPIGRVVNGWDVVENLYSAYGAAPMRTDLSTETFLRDFPQLDSIRSTVITRMW